MRRAARFTQRRAAIANPTKFGVGPSPLEQEARIDTIQPTSEQEATRLLEMIDKIYPTSSENQKRALDFWRVQLARTDMEAQVKYEFLRRFNFWLLGRGTDADTGKTLWGRGNAAAVNPEVRSYIEQFAEKRLRYALQLSVLSQRVPETLTQYYLYFKYIVNGNLKITKAPDGSTFFDMSHEDFLADFDMMQQVFENDSQAGYAEIIKPAATKPARDPGFGGTNAHPSDPYPASYEARKEHQLDQPKMAEQANQAIANRYGLNYAASSGQGGAGGPKRPIGDGDEEGNVSGPQESKPHGWESARDEDDFGTGEVVRGDMGYELPPKEKEEIEEEAPVEVKQEEVLEEEEEVEVKLEDVVKIAIEDAQAALEVLEKKKRGQLKTEELGPKVEGKRESKPVERFE